MAEMMISFGLVFCPAAPPPPLAAKEIPNRARLLASVPPLVKTIRSGCRPVIRADQPPDPLARIVEQLPRPPPRTMLTGRIAVALLPAFGHRGDNFSRQRRRRIMIEIDHAHFRQKTNAAISGKHSPLEVDDTAQQPTRGQSKNTETARATQAAPPELAPHDHQAQLSRAPITAGWQRSAWARRCRFPA